MMVSRLSLLALAGALTLAGTAHGADAHGADAHGADLRVIDTYLAITGAGTTSAPAGRLAAGELAPLDARVIALGAGSAVVYYTRDKARTDVVRVVTTVGTDADGVAPSTRFVSYLAPGQKAEVSVATAAGTAPAVLELAYDGGRLAVRPVAPARPES